MASPSSDTVPVVVWGGGTGGVAAALQAARSGAATLLLTPGAWLGGMVSAAGVCCPDGNELTPWQTGLWGALLRALAREEPQGLDHNWVSCFGYRPTTAEAILQRWVQATNRLQWWPHTRILAVERQGRRVVAVLVQRDQEQVRLSLEVLIDGSDRGDLLPLADAAHRLGWEPQEAWGEPSAPSAERLRNDAFFQQQPVQSPTWVVMGQLASDHLPADPLQGLDPQGVPLLPAPFTEACRAFGLEKTLSYGRLPGGLVMLNWPLHGNDWHQGLDRAFSVEVNRQEELAGEMRSHSLAFAAALREASGGWLSLGQAFPADSGAPSPSLAVMPYWREGRRLVGQRLVLEQHLLPIAAGQSIAPLPLDADGAVESIAVGNYANDHHYPGADWPLAPKSCRWGGRWSGTPFAIPYGSLVSAEVENLLAADKAFSTSHMANGATRLQPLILNIGQAAGAAAALAVRHRRPPGQLPVRWLQEALLADPLAPAAVVPLWDTPWHHPHWRNRQRAVLEDPGLLASDGRWLGTDPAGAAAPAAADAGAGAEPGERLWRGRLVPDGQGAYCLELDGGGQWPLITLEPQLHVWLSRQDRPLPGVTLIGCANPWGPWLRASRLA